MPIEIKELYIKAVVTDKQKTDTGCHLMQDDINKIKRELTKEVTDNVIRILQQKNER
jgi:hypothetical protein